MVQPGQCGTGVDRKGVPEDARPDQVPVMARIVQHEDDATIHGAVALLQRETPDQCLCVANVRLGLDAGSPAPPGEHCVPGAQVGSVRGHLVDDSHLDLPADPTPEPPAEPGKQSLLSAVAQRLPAGKGSRGKLEPDQGRQPSEQDQ